MHCSPLLGYRCNVTCGLNILEKQIVCFQDEVCFEFTSVSDKWECALLSSSIPQWWWAAANPGTLKLTGGQDRKSDRVLSHKLFTG